MKSMSVSMKLIVSFAIVAALAILMSCVGILSSNTINKDYSYVLDYPIERKNDLRGIQQDFLMMRYRTANYIMNSGDAEFITNTSMVQYQSAYTALKNKINVYVSRNNSDSVRNANDIRTNLSNANRLEALLAQFDNGAKIVGEHAIAGDTRGADDVLKGIIPLTNEINGLLDEMIASTDAFVTDNITAINHSADNSIFILIVLSVFCVAVSVLLTAYISHFTSNSISKPLKALASLMKKAGSTGNISLQQEDLDIFHKLEKVKNEIGQTAEGCEELITHITHVAKTLESVANGDLTAEITPITDQDDMGVSLHKMVGNLNTMFRDIQNSSVQVSSGSKQVADSAQILAQGSTEQAATIEELSGSISEISQKTNDTAKMAGRAAALAGTIMNNAEKGNRQMDEMTSAVRDINMASQSIGKVIKVIDDIAFQTNILALNAAVEAARAGSHGKGFAVVAEEVRNLAAKSAEAAKETGEMIQNSMEKAELGSRIANETAASLSEIVSGISESSNLIDEISRASVDQSSGINQINIGIDQVAQVVQQNSATAEESAAASEEMSGQSDMLQQLISQFRLKDEGSMFKRLASPEKPVRNRLTTPEKNEYALSGQSMDYGKY